MKTEIELQKDNIEYLRAQLKSAQRELGYMERGAGNKAQEPSDAINELKALRFESHITRAALNNLALALSSGKRFGQLHWSEFCDHLGNVVLESLRTRDKREL